MDLIITLHGMGLVEMEGEMAKVEVTEMEVVEAEEVELEVSEVSEVSEE